MKLLPLYDLQQEVNRLFIAGSKFAKNDPRLQKQVAIFNKLGEKAPVFKKIAENIESLLNADSIESSGKLLELSTLLYSVLYTQGETFDPEQPQAELNPVLPIKDITTEKSYQALKPLIEALTEQKQGRLEILKDAFENNQLNDFRTYHLLNNALGDRYTELADYIETTVIPSIGAPMLPFLINSFNYEGKADDVRRFRLLIKLGYKEVDEMVDKVFEGKSVPLQAEAVLTLAKDAKNEEMLLKFADDKQKPIRLAAYEALGILNTDNAQQKLVDLFISGKKKSDITELSEALKARLLDKFIPQLLEKAKNTFEECIALIKDTDIKVITAKFDELRVNMNPLLNNPSDEIFKFYEQVFLSKKYKDIAKHAESKSSYFTSPERIAESAAHSLENMEEGFECLKHLAEKSSYVAFFYAYFRACINGGMSKEDVYKNFANDIDKLLTSNVFYNAFADKEDRTKLNSDLIDMQWANLLKEKLPRKKEVSINNVRVYLELVGINSEEARSFLFDMVYSVKDLDYTFNRLAEYLIESKHPKAYESVFETISTLAKSCYFYSYNARYLRQFPKEYAEKFRKLGEAVAKSKNAYYSHAYNNAADAIEDANWGK